MMKKLTINIVSESAVSVKGHGVHTAFLEMVRAFKKRDDMTVIVNDFHGTKAVDIVHIHTVGISAIRPLLFGRGKRVVSAHVIPESLIGSLVLAKYWLWLAKWYMQWFYNRADVVVAVSQTVAQALKDNLNISPSHIHTIYNSIDTARYITTGNTKQQAREQLKLTTASSVIIGVGQLQPRKRLDTFIACASALPECHFIWVGGIPFKQLGADYHRMKKMLETLPQNMQVTGLIDHDDVQRYLQAADVFMLPAEQENHPMAVIEAAAAGLPIVLRDLPEYDDSFQDDILRCKTDQDFITALQKLTTYKSLRAVYKKKSAQIAHRFDSAHVSEQFVKLYKKLLQERA